MDNVWNTNVDNFAHFASTFAPAEIKGTGICLEPLLAGWLYVGDGIDYTAAKYDHFLQTTIRIIDAVTKGTLPLDYLGPDLAPFPRRLTGLVDPTTKGNVLTRLGFDQVVHETLELRRAEQLREVSP